MNKRILNKIICNETGSGLVLSLMVLLVLSVLGAILGVVTVGSYRLADNTQESNSAYYIAEAGANMAYEEVKHYVLEAYKGSDSPVSFFDKMSKPLGKDNNLNTIEYTNFSSQPIKQQKALVSITDDTSTTDVQTKVYTLKSIGELEGKTRTLEKKFNITWIDSQPDSSLDLNLNSVLTFYRSPTINNSTTVYGDITYPSSLSLNISNIFDHKSGKPNPVSDTEMSWTEKGSTLHSWLTPIIENEINNYNFENDKNSKSPYNNKYTINKDVISNKENITFNQGVDFTGNIISNGGDITINNSAIVRGDIISNGGDITFNNGVSISGNIISNGGKITVNNSSTINGSIITTGNSKDITINNKATIRGNIVANGGHISLNNSMDVTGAILNPRGNITINNEGKFVGLVFVNKLTANNSNTLTYSEDYLNYFPFNKDQNVGGNNEPSLDELITYSSPIIEQ